MPIELEKLSILGLNIVLFPNTVVQVHLCRDSDCEVAQQCYSEGSEIGISLLHEGSEESGEESDLYLVGTRAKILHLEVLSKGGISLRLKGLQRYRIRKLDFDDDDQITGVVEPLVEENPANPHQVDALAMRVEELFSEFLESSLFDAQVNFQVAYPSNSTAISFIVSNFFQLELIQKQYLLELTDTALRLKELISHLLDRIENKTIPEIYEITTAELREWIWRN
jgi:ATP-dependent Lon protease